MPAEKSQVDTRLGRVGAHVVECAHADEGMRKRRLVEGGDAAAYGIGIFTEAQKETTAAFMIEGPAMHDPPDDDFTLQTMLALRQAVEEIGDEAGRRHAIAAFTAYVDAFVAHVPRDDGEAVESLLLARYFSFLPLVPADVGAKIRDDLETVLGHLTGGDTSVEVVDALWRVHGGLADFAAQGRWTEDERDVPIATIVGKVLIWARSALSA